MTIQQAFEVALQHHQAGRLAEAEALYRQILAVEPRHADALHLLGVIAHQVGRDDLSVELIGKALAISPPQAVYHSNLGEAHRGRGQLIESISCYQRAIALAPDFGDAHSNLSLALRDTGRIAEAIAAGERAVALQPDSPGSLNNLGLALHDAGRFDEAIGRFRRVLEINRDDADAAYNLGNALHASGRSDEAIACYQRALALRPEFPGALNNLGNVFKDRDQFDTAADIYRRALEIQPGHVASHVNLGNVFKELGQLDDSIQCYRRALAIQPDCLTAHCNVVYTLQFHPACDDATIAGEHRLWNRQFAHPLKELILPHANDRSPNRRLRVGYVSPDFRFHSEAYFVVPLLEAHDHHQFEIHCYASLLRPDHVTERLRRAVDVWHNVQGQSDHDLAQQIRRDGIDILVDLTMHMACNRLLVFARKPAPVQVTWLAYPGSTGLETMDYRITDHYMDPASVETPYYSEISLRLPECWVCYHPLTDEPPVNPLPASNAGQITFGCLNNFCKLNDEMLGLFGSALRAMEGSRLILLAPEGRPRERVIDRVCHQGVPRDRIEFVGRMSRPDYLKTYHRIDIALDTRPYNGITTTCDALWMGVPVVSLEGQTAAGRAGLGILSTVKLPELAVRSPEEFVRAAENLGSDLPRLTELREELRHRMQSSPMMDAQRFARNMENAYRTMWQHWCMGKKPSAP